ncbi:MAG: ATP synthase F1 subunit epsilon [Lachnospiraceae bacterium]|jgi:F-type H+-transporting ATPase subunit epsilon|nr:ATP synthase F1 subunit epsilon [Lachnospiraceae bacterium]
MADKNLFELKIITPDRVFYEGQVSMVEFNTSEGEIGVLGNHIPLTVVVAPGVMTITEELAETERKEAALHAGFAEILPDKVTILAEIVEWPNEIDVKRAESARERAEERIGRRLSETDLARAETALHRAVARINVVSK